MNNKFDLADMMQAPMVKTFSNIFYIDMVHAVKEIREKEMRKKIIENIKDILK